MRRILLENARRETKLARENQAAADLAKLHLFAGLTVDEAAESLGVSRRTGFHR
jgi:DNA-binding transcriptional regulator LsrR (DeoR family)